MSNLPEKNTDYSRVDYWNQRYESEDSFEWCKDYKAFKHLLVKEIQPSDRILVLGCGNSQLSEDMYRDGFRCITNIDYSEVVIENMRDRSPEARSMQWIVMDMTDLKFPNGSFDVVIEKATLDALLVHEPDPWKLSPESGILMERILTQVNKVLNPDSGRFISITFSQPHFRKPIYARPDIYDWGDLRTCTFGDTFHFYLYIVTRGRSLEPLLPIITNSSVPDDPVLFPEDDSYLNSIEL